MSDLVGNPEDWFSHNEAHICSHKSCSVLYRLVTIMLLMLTLSGSFVFSQLLLFTVASHTGFYIFYFPYLFTGKGLFTCIVVDVIAVITQYALFNVTR